MISRNPCLALECTSFDSRYLSICPLQAATAMLEYARSFMARNVDSGGSRWRGKAPIADAWRIPATACDILTGLLMPAAAAAPAGVAQAAAEQAAEKAAQSPSASAQQPAAATAGAEAAAAAAAAVAVSAAAAAAAIATPAFVTEMALLLQTLGRFKAGAGSKVDLLKPCRPSGKSHPSSDYSSLKSTPCMGFISCERCATFPIVEQAVHMAALAWVPRGALVAAACRE